MRWLRKLLDRQAARFGKGGSLERFYPLYEAMDSFFFASAKRSTGIVHVRDGADLKRVMFTVVISLIPCALMAMYKETGDPRWCPPLLLRRKVKSGHLGRKTGRGWYEYDTDGKKKE